MRALVAARVWSETTLPEGTENLRFVVANPPFSSKPGATLRPGQRSFPSLHLWRAASENGDLAFVLHILTCLKSTGKAAVNLPHGVLFRAARKRRSAAKLSDALHQGIIGLPANLFYGTGIPACIIVLDKENAAARKASS